MATINPETMWVNAYKKLKLYGVSTFTKYLIIELQRIIYWNLVKKSFSQRQEDLFIDRYFGGKKEGFYVDIGASDPTRFSNTKRFYEMGWHGINVEPNTILIEKFIRERPRDVNLNFGIGNSTGKMALHVFFPDTLSTFSTKESELYIQQGFSVEKKIDIEIKTLKEVLDKHAQGIKVDFMTIDTEGNDLSALQSNNWDKFRPTLLCVEVSSHNGNGNNENAIQNFLKNVGYSKIHDSGINAVYIDKLTKDQ